MLSKIAHLACGAARPYLRGLIFVLFVLGLTASGIQYRALSLPISPPAPAGPFLTDGLVVATGGQARIPTGLNLMIAGRAKRMLLTGVGSGITKDMLASSLTLSRLQKHQLICCVDLDFTAADTAGNAKATANWMQMNGFETLRLVTANYHIARARLEFERQMPNITIRYFAVSPPDLNPEGWYSDWRVARLLLRESVKYMAARLWYALTPQP